MIKRLISIGITGLALIMLAPFAYAIPDLPAAPNQDEYVFDYAKILAPGTVTSLHYKLKTLEEETSTEMAVVTVDSLQDYTVEEFSIELARKWGIGQEEHDNGLLFLVAPNERKVRIEVGYGLEGSITDAKSGQIIRNLIIPNFQKGDFDTGIAKAAEALNRLARNEDFSIPTEEPQTDWAVFLIYLLPFFWIILSWMSSSKSWWLGGIFGGIIALIVAATVVSLIAGILIGLAVDFILSTFLFGKIKPPSGGGFFGGGSSGGGSFGGFSGGGFGGGGASGSW